MNKFIPSQKNSLLHKILTINLSLLTIHIVLFLAFFSFSASRLTKEYRTTAETTLKNLNIDFQLELQRLNILSKQCLEDSSLIFTLSDKLDMDFFLENAEDAAAKMDIIINALPYAKQVFVYSRSSDKIVTNSASIYSSESYLNYSLNTPSRPFFRLNAPASLEDGFHYYGNNALYIRNLCSYGYLAILIDLNQFANFSKKLDNYSHLYITDDQADLVLQDSSLNMKASDFSRFISGEMVKIGSSKYLYVSEPMSVNPYTSHILIDFKTIYNPTRYLLFAGLISFVILLVNCLLLIYLNIKIYLPLREFSTAHGYSGQTDEISFIENKVHDLLYEIYLLSEQNPDTRPVLSDKVIFHYLMYGGYQLSEIYLTSLREKYPFHRVLVLITQDDQGETDSFFTASLEKQLTEKFSVNFVNMSHFICSIVIQPKQQEEIISYIEEAVNLADKQIKVYAGISPVSNDILSVNTSCQIALNKALGTTLSFDSRFIFDEDAQISTKHHLNMDLYNRLLSYAQNHTDELFVSTMQQLLFQENMNLSSFLEYYEEAMRIMDKVIGPRQPEPSSEKHSKPALYNTNYIFRLLQERAKLLHTETDSTEHKREKILAYIQDNLSNELSLDTVADAFSITPVYLSSWFKKNMSTNFTSYISSLRMEKAITLLKSETCPKIYEISQMVGIENTATFIQQFKKYTGVTPGQFRKNLLQTEKPE